MKKTVTAIFTTDLNETIVSMVLFKRGVVIATSRRVMYYGPKGDLHEIPSLAVKQTEDA